MTNIVQTNTAKAIAHIIDNPTATVNPAKISSNRINNVGDALEMFVKDAYCGLLGSNLDQVEKDSHYAKAFAWLGNNNNPPDFLLRDGDGIEVKKIQSLGADIALNSSFPKNKLYCDDSRVAKGAKTAEKWEVRDIVYTIGTVEKEDLKRLWFIYGDCYAASKECYELLIRNITAGVALTPDIDFYETNELAKIKKVDPLGITDMRVRGMWHIQNPSKLYSHLISSNPKNQYQRQYYFLMREDKYLSFPKEDRISLEIIELEGYSNSIIEIRNPDNPADLLKARFIKYEF